jgi:hypothetical protein
MDQDFTPFSTALARAQFWRDGRKSVENGEPSPACRLGQSLPVSPGLSADLNLAAPGILS